MKNYHKIVILLAFCSSSFLNAQILDPVKWETSVEKIDDGTYELIATANIDPGWHLYSQSVPKDGPIPTSFKFEPDDSYKLLRYTVEEKGITVNDPFFNMEIKYFSDTVDFRQRIRIMDKSTKTVTGEVEFMVCDNARCLPPKIQELVFEIP